MICSHFTVYFHFMVSWYISQKTYFHFKCGILSSEIIRSPAWRLVDRIRLFTRCLWDLADASLWRGHFGAQTDLKLRNHTWNWEQRNPVTASRVYSLRWVVKPSLHTGQKSLWMKLHLANLTDGSISLRIHLYSHCYIERLCYDGTNCII